jgi:hypothetical protein
MDTPAVARTVGVPAAPSWIVTVFLCMAASDVAAAGRDKGLLPGSGAVGSLLSASWDTLKRPLDLGSGQPKGKKHDRQRNS